MNSLSGWLFTFPVFYMPSHIVLPITLMEKETEAQRGLVTGSRSDSLLNERPGVWTQLPQAVELVLVLVTASLSWPRSVTATFASVFHIISKPTESSNECHHYLSPGGLSFPPSRVLSPHFPSYNLEILFTTSSSVILKGCNYHSSAPRAFLGEYLPKYIEIFVFPQKYSSSEYRTLFSIWVLTESFVLTQTLGRTH